MSKASLVNIEKRITVKEDKQKGIHNYDVDNAYPQRVEDILNASGTGTLCTSILKKFIFGQGFEDENLGKLIVNDKGETVNDLLDRSAADPTSKFNGFALHVNYNALYKISSVNLVPFQDVRFTTSDNKEHPNVMAVYDDWQQNDGKIQWDNVDYINFYNADPETIQEEVDNSEGETESEKWANYKGQILYWSIDGKNYPLAPSDSVLEDVMTDSQSKLFKNRNINSNFMASHILEVDEFEDDKLEEAFNDTITEFQGADNTSQILVLQKKAGQEGASFELKKVEIQDVDKLYEYTEISTRNSIILVYEIPRVLFISEAGKLGTSSEMKDAFAIYNGITNFYRLKISEQFEKIFKGFRGTNFDNYLIKPIEADIVLFKDTTEGKQKIVELLINTSIPRDNKLIILEKIYGFPTDEALLLLPQETIQNPVIA